MHFSDKLIDSDFFKEFIQCFQIDPFLIGRTYLLSTKKNKFRIQNAHLDVLMTMRVGRKNSNIDE